jgi:hypothetical protein
MPRNAEMYSNLFRTENVISIKHLDTPMHSFVTANTTTSFRKLIELF